MEFRGDSGNEFGDVRTIGTNGQHHRHVIGDRQPGGGTTHLGSTSSTAGSAWWR